MEYELHAIAPSEIPSAQNPLLDHALETYASEINKVVSVWRAFAAGDLGFKPHPRSSTVLDVMRHQLLSERRFFGEFLGCPEPPAANTLPDVLTPETMINRLVGLAKPRIPFLADQPDPWWLEQVRFFDVERRRIWIFWRRVLHTAHHRAQLTVYLRLLDKPVVSTYGPSADMTWAGADPTLTVESAQRS